MAILICLKKVKRREKGWRWCVCVSGRGGEQGGPQGAGEKSTPSGRSILKCDKAAQVPPPRDKAPIEATLSDKHHAFFLQGREAKQRQPHQESHSGRGSVGLVLFSCFSVAAAAAALTATLFSQAL